MTEAYFAFQNRPEPGEFVIKLTDPAKIDHARKILLGQETQRVHVHGRIIKRPEPYNPGWSFHLDPATIDFFDMAIEVCDAGIQYTEDHLDEACGAFLPGCHWCPWGSTLVREVGGSPGKKIADGWAGLKDTAFAAGIDAACTVPGSSTDLYLFKGNQYLRYRATEEKVTSGPKAIADGWPGLKSTAFADGIDAACATPGRPLNVYLFKGSQYAEYQTPDEKITAGPKAIAHTWQLAEDFTTGLDEVCRVPGHATDLYFFKKDRYARGR
ncbi:hemopexin repeat-containing protein [Embleya sp. NBC_00896]|uniref:BP74-related protein n=1 Tax=Embleya sp. NBC_00896 TaxID=2975961 RepID=UPI003870B9F1|nr:hemopexin repeat-containing protein [Embleya sp. NBC_00896]